MKTRFTTVDIITVLEELQPVMRTEYLCVMVAMRHQYVNFCHVDFLTS
jgi:hypothetical protein